MEYRKSISRIRVARALVGFAVSAAMVAGSAQAATQGTLGATSSGSISISATVPNRAQITGLADVTFASVDPGSPATSSQSDCVWSNTSTKGYSITATGSGTSGAFTLVNSASATVPYTVQWAASASQTSGSSLTAGTALTGLTSTATTPTCASGPSTTSSLVVNMSAAALQSMTASTSYTGTLTLLVTPQ
jgi:hypothetical protein